jgi:hypothetical protein
MKIVVVKNNKDNRLVPFTLLPNGEIQITSSGNVDIDDLVVTTLDADFAIYMPNLMVVLKEGNYGQISDES